MKAADSKHIEKMAGRVSSLFRDGQFAGYFGNDCVLVPVPRSSKLPRNSVWIGDLICQMLVNAKIAPLTEQMLQREKPVPKSAFARPGERPGPQRHYDSLSFSETLVQYDRVVLVDDIVTRGSTLMGCAMRLRKHMPNTKLMAFAMARTMGPVNDIDKWLDPCTGTITFNGETLNRDP